MSEASLSPASTAIRVSATFAYPRPHLLPRSRSLIRSRHRLDAKCPKGDPSKRKRERKGTKHKRIVRLLLQSYLSRSFIALSLLSRFRDERSELTAESRT